MAVFSFVYSSLTFSFQIYKLIFKYLSHHSTSAKGNIRISITKYCIYAIDKHTAINNIIFCTHFLQEFTFILQFYVEVYSIQIRFHEKIRKNRVFMISSTQKPAGMESQSDAHPEHISHFL